MEIINIVTNKIKIREKLTTSNNIDIVPQTKTQFKILPIT